MKEYFVALLPELLVVSVVIGGLYYVTRPDTTLRAWPVAPVTSRLQDVPMPPPGNPDHTEPAPGAYCSHDVQAPEHACACQPGCMPDIDPTTGEEVPGTEHRTEDNLRCRSACHPKHCRCISRCEP